MWKLIVTLILLAVPGLGYYNYQRNAHLDQELENRTFDGLSEPDLRALEGAYSAELEQLRTRIADAPRILPSLSWLS